MIRARTVVVDDDVDLGAFAGDDGVLFQREGVGVAGRGEALRIEGPLSELPKLVADALASIEGEAVAVGALPFDVEATGSMVVPRQVLRRHADGRASLTTVGEPVPGPAGRVAMEQRAPDAFSLTAVQPHDQWCERVARAVAAVRSGRLRKVVLAREVLVECNRPIPPAQVPARLRALYPACRVFSVDGFLGASPELLVSRRGRSVVSHPLAGTVARSGDPDVDARLAAGLLASHKEREEHAVVVDDVAERLRSLCSRVDVPEGPSVVSFRNVSHLGTRVTAELSDPETSALALVAALHPTPAVAGAPTDEALRFIAEVEGLDRGRYAGPVGWVDSRGDGDWAVGIRSAEVDGATARLYAGVGIVAESDPEAELVETQLKLQALLAALVRP